MIWEHLEKYMDRQLEEENKKKQLEKEKSKQMNSKMCIQILQTMAIGSTEKDAIEYAIRKIKKAKKLKKQMEKVRAEIENTIVQEKLAFNGQFDKGLNMALLIFDKYTKSE